MKPIRLEPKFVERIWGSTELKPWFPNPKKTVGEVWFTADDNETSEGISLRALMEREGPQILGTSVQPAFGGRFPILVKFLFTRDKLSVQVHPDDSYAQENENSPGKSEMWYVLRAGEGASIAAGFERPIHSAELRDAVNNGAVESLVKWWPAHAGEVYFIPARTVHALGAGLVICEIQQNSDVTYRLWDYGRRRELHVESALAVADLDIYPGPSDPVPFGGGDLLASCPYFATERFHIDDNCEWYSDSERFHLIVVTEGSGNVEAGGVTEALQSGQCWLIPATTGAYRIHGKELEILRIYVPA